MEQQRKKEKSDVIMLSPKLNWRLFPKRQQRKNPKGCRSLYLERSGIKVPIQLARQFMKEKLWLTSKLGKSRPALLNEQKHLIIKSYFAVRVAKLLPFIDIIVNVYETCFSHYLMKNRSWLRKGLYEIVTKKICRLNIINFVHNEHWMIV